MFTWTKISPNQYSNIHVQYLQTGASGSELFAKDHIHRVPTVGYFHSTLGFPSVRRGASTAPRGSTAYGVLPWFGAPSTSAEPSKARSLPRGRQRLRLHLHCGRARPRLRGVAQGQANAWTGAGFWCAHGGDVTKVEPSMQVTSGLLQVKSSILRKEADPELDRHLQWSALGHAVVPHIVCTLRLFFFRLDEPNHRASPLPMVCSSQRAPNRTRCSGGSSSLFVALETSWRRPFSRSPRPPFDQRRRREKTGRWQ